MGLVFCAGCPSQTLSSPDRSLAKGRWVKLIAGASNENLPAIADLCGLFARAGVDCVDVAAEPGVVDAARSGLAWAERHCGSRPWLMVSLSDGEDLHFRKARFDPLRCPSHCQRPCERICPALAISTTAGVDQRRCYGCGRCLPACPHQLIESHSTTLPPSALPALLRELNPDAIELHTALGRGEAFSARLDQVASAGLRLQRLSVSCGPPSHQQEGIALLARELWDRYQRLRRFPWQPIWQLDGRPMSGDVGNGVARAAVRLWLQLRRLAPPGPLQLAGGTNAHSLAFLRRAGESGTPPPAAPTGVAFGGSARSLLQPLWLKAHSQGIALREHPALAPEALALARQLIQPWKLGPEATVSEGSGSEIAPTIARTH